jgi:hypothetical protein
VKTKMTAVALLLAACASTALAQPTITSLGAGLPLSVTNAQGGVVYVGGQLSNTVRWSISSAGVVLQDTGSAGGGGQISADGLFVAGHQLNTGPQVFGNSAAAVSPVFNPNVTLTPSTTQPAATEFVGARWSAASNSWLRTGGLPINRPGLVFGSGSSGQASGNFVSVNTINSTGRFMGGLAYISGFNNTGNTVSAASGRWRPFLWDADANAGAGQMIQLATPQRTTSPTQNFRTGNVYDISSDGTVVLGAQEHNIGGTGGDSGALAVWRLNTTTGQYEFSLLPNGAGSSTPSAYVMNDAGTIIVGRATIGMNTFIGKWTWDAGTSTWTGPDVVGSALATQASWLPASVTGCGLPPTLGGSIAMNEDASIIVGTATYSTCGGFMAGGFIASNSSGEYVLQDWYDYNAARNVPGVSVGGFFGPTGDNGDPTRGLPVLGYPTSVSRDGLNFAGFQGGNTRIPGAPGWVMQDSGGTPCLPPVISTQPSATATFSACSSSVTLSTFVSGSPAFSYQWFKDGQALSDGSTPSGSVVSGATQYLLRIAPPLTPSDAGTYYAVVTGQCGTPVQTANAVVSVDPAFATPATNDTCATARVVSTGTNLLTPAQSVCNAFTTDNFGIACTSSALKTDLWYSFTPTTSGNYRVETCGATFDTVLAIYDNCFGSQVACNDNYESGPTTGCTSSRSRVLSAALNAGQAYLIRVAAPSGAFLSNTSVTNLTIVPAPASAPNDQCSNATLGVIGANPFDLNEATNDWVAVCNTARSRDVWFQYVPTATGVVRFSTCGGTLNTVLSAYDQCFGNELACNDNLSVTGCSQQSQFDLNVTNNTPVLIRVGTASATTVGTGNLTISTVGCDSIDFNNDGLFPDDNDLIALLTVLAGGDCPTVSCSDIDFNNDGLFPDDTDLVSFLSVLAGGAC